ncbi:MAG TPA: sulfatase-like hydrolase/transferase [Sedimentisphaerales bacterium]|nr:sulfatase-like hydrolase/transferase [Sedimentisphaerales bacterium]
MASFKNNINRRRFLQISSGSVASMFLPQIPVSAEGTSKTQPNILWVSCEDISPDLGCYGDTYAVSPNIDKLAAQGVRYSNVYSHSGVCAPTRSGIITGMYPTTIGTHHMRCKGVPPAYVKAFSEYLRAAGYYCTNNVKTDYQFDPPPSAWNESSRKAHWRGRAEGQPFFAVFNFTTSHESQIRNRSDSMLKRLANLKPDEKHDPAKAVLPPYYPDTPAVRRDWAQYYDVITLMDKQVGDVLKQLEDEGLADNTIVWFWGDHGRGLPRGKRWIYDSGLRVPLVIRVPKKLRKLAMPGNPDVLEPGTVNDDLVAFIDFAPTMLSLTGIKIPEYIQGRAFLGSQKAGPRDYIFAARDRMDEAYDLIRAVRDKRYKYIRNYMWHLTRGQDIDYMNQMPTMQEMRRLNAEGKLKGPQKQYFEETKPVEELYDTLSDPHEVNNLADNPEYKSVLERMRRVHKEWMKEIGDVGLIPEPEFDEMKRPDGRYQKTAEPVFWSPKWQAGTPGKTARRITIACPTAGASIVYRISDNGKTGNAWKLYRKSVWLTPGKVLHAKACRIGFEDSREVQFKFDDKVTTPKRPQTPAKDEQHWRNKLDRTDLLERLRKIKELDSQGNKAIKEYFKALSDKYASVRYWAVIGLHNNCKSSSDIERAKATLEKSLKDPATIVRVAAAHAMCDWGEEKEALPVLAEALKDKTDKARLYAVIALNKIGEKARPFLPQIKAAVEDSDNYVQRVARTTLNQLGSE